MFDTSLGSLLPRSAVAGIALWGAAHYFVAGPAIASRIAVIDHLPQCEADIKKLALDAGRRRAEALPPPSSDPAQDFAADQLRLLRDNPLMRELEELGGLGDLFGMGDALDAVTQGREHARQAAKQAYDTAIKRLEEQTASRLAVSGSICSCLAGEAIAQGRAEWAIFTGTLGLVRPTPVSDFGAEIAKARMAGRCAKFEETAP